MIKNILLLAIFSFNITFVVLVVNTYLSNELEKKINDKRKTVEIQIENNINGLPILVADTNDVIEFNYGFENINTKKKRSFWQLFKKND
tara:strand:- start:937 stop:1203 length:267 start_codon:yes stop_codon:yes gene_type:complete